MRFNKRITFVKETEAYYDPDLGEYVEGEPVKDTVPCNLSPMKVDRKKELFGELDIVVVVARLQRPYTKEFDYIEISERKVEMLHRSDYRKGVFYLEGAF